MACCSPTPGCVRYETLFLYPPNNTNQTITLFRLEEPTLSVTVQNSGNGVNFTLSVAAPADAACVRILFSYNYLPAASTPRKVQVAGRNFSIEGRGDQCPGYIEVPANFTSQFQFHGTSFSSIGFEFNAIYYPIVPLLRPRCRPVCALPCPKIEGDTFYGPFESLEVVNRVLIGLEMPTVTLTYDADVSAFILTLNAPKCTRCIRLRVVTILSTGTDTIDVVFSGDYRTGPTTLCRNFDLLPALSENIYQVLIPIPPGLTLGFTSVDVEYTTTANN